MANKYLIERCRLNLEAPRLDSVFFRQCLSVGVKRPNKPIDGLIELYQKYYSNFPVIECKTGAGVFMDAIAKQQAINFKQHCKSNLLNIQKRFYKAFLRHEEHEEDY